MKIVALPLAALAGLFLFNLRLTGRLRKTALSALFILPAGAAAEIPIVLAALVERPEGRIGMQQTSRSARAWTSGSTR